ncbi:MAG: hypothetical protein U0800_18545 [Isosphaeraceae bacterium]
MQVLGQLRGVLGGVVGKSMLFAVATIAVAGAMPSKAEAARFTVYIYNTRTNYGWIRTGFTHDLYTSEAACRNSIVNRVNENRRYRTDFEAFAVVYQSSPPPFGLLQGGIRAYIMYFPGRGYIASADDPARLGITALCQAEPRCDRADIGEECKTPDARPRHQPILRNREEALA